MVTQNECYAVFLLSKRKGLILVKNTKDYMREYMRKKRAENPNLNKDYYESHKEQMRESSKKWYEKNKEKRLKRIREYHKENKEKVYEKYFKPYHNKYQKERCKIDPKFKLDRKMLHAISRTLKNVKNPNEEIWINLLGYKMTDLRAYLKTKIPEGYTWQDYLDGKLELDHIIPRYLFDYTSIHDSSFKKCWAMKNLRLLPKEKNKLNYFTGFKCKAQEGIYATTA